MSQTTRRNVLQGAFLAGSAAAFTAAPSRAAAMPGATYVSLTELGGIPDDSTYDNTPALNAAIARRVPALYIPRGRWYFLSQPRPFTHPMRVVGEGFSTSYLIRSYLPLSESDGLLTVHGGSVHIGNLGIGAGGATTGGAGIALVSDGRSSPDFSVIEDVYISVEPEAPGTWANAVVIDGSARTAAPIGVRDVELRNCYLFASTQAACRIHGGVSISVRGGGMFPAAGLTGRLQVSGTSSVCSHYVTVDASFLGGLDFQNCKYVNVRAAVIAGDITNTGSAEDIIVTGTCTGVVQEYWTRGCSLDARRMGSVPNASTSPARMRIPQTPKRSTIFHGRLRGFEAR